MEKRFKGKKVPKTVMINNWIDENEIYPLDENNKKVLEFEKRYGLDGKFVIMYSGNIGLYYDLEKLIEVVERFKPGTKTADGREIVFAFVGAGSVLDKLVLYVKQHHMDNVTFIPYQDKADLIYSLNAGDVHWCVNAKGIKGVSCPSKAYGIMAASKPILGVLESGSEIRCLIEDTHGGLCCEPGEYDKVEENIHWFIENAGNSELKAMGARGRENLEKNLTQKCVGEKVCRRDSEAVKEARGMNSNWFKLVMKMTKVEYGKNLLLKGVPIIFNKGGAKLKIGENVTIKSSFLSNLVGLYSRTIIVTRAPGARD
ncbi:MAG: glycosyltransferase [Ruminococcus sp.]